MATNGQAHHLHFGRARSALSGRGLSAGQGQGDRPHHQGLSGADRGLAVLRDGDQRPGRARLARRAAIPRASCAWSTRRPSILPDRRGNNRIDSLRNLVTDPRVALIFLIPGVSETVRVMGRATISTDPELCASFAMQGKAPRCVLVIAVEQVFFQCAKAIVRSKLWDPSIQVERATPADRRKNPRRDQRRQGRRRRARPPRAGADDADDLLRLLRRLGRGRDGAGGVTSCLSSLLVPAARLQPLLHVRRHRRHDLDRRLVPVERHHDLARVQMHARRVARRAAVDVVAQDREAHLRAMHAQLVRPPGQRLERQPGRARRRGPSPSTSSATAGPPDRASSTSRGCRRAGRAACRCGPRRPPARPRPRPNRSCRPCRCGTAG